MHCIVHCQCLFKRPDMCLGHRHWRLSEGYKQKEVSLLSTLNSLLLIFHSLELVINVFSSYNISTLPRRKEMGGKKYNY